MGGRLTGDWSLVKKALDPGSFLPLLEKNVKTANERSGLEISGSIQRRLVDQVGMSGKGSEGPGELHPFTVHRRNTRRDDNAARAGDARARRRQSRQGRKGRPSAFRTRRGRPHKRLIDRGGLLRRITHRAQRLAFIVGVRRQSGNPRHSVAAIQEWGAVVNVTPKMRAWLHSKGLHLKPSTTRIEIPGQLYMTKGLKGAGSVARRNWSAAVEATVEGRKL